VQTVIDPVYRYCGQKESVIFCDQIMGLGFREAFKAGISFGKDDMLIPDTKWPIVNAVRDQLK
jgi:DNA-directed RNA polymerase subunit beta'